MTDRNDIIRIARKAGIPLGKVFVDGTLVDCVTVEVQRFAELVAAHVLAQRAPSIVISTTDIDPDLLREMLAKAKPMPIEAMPPAPDVAAAVAAERDALATTFEEHLKTSHGLMGDETYRMAVRHCLEVIRARGTPC